MIRTIWTETTIELFNIKCMCVEYTKVNYLIIREHNPNQAFLTMNTVMELETYGGD